MNNTVFCLRTKDLNSNSSKNVEKPMTSLYYLYVNKMKSKILPKLQREHLKSRQKCCNVTETGTIYYLTFTIKYVLKHFYTSLN